MHIDLNADVGEGAIDTPLFPYLSSVNIACGWHAGDAECMNRTVIAAAKRKLAIGAHPSFPDRCGFGRQPMNLPEPALYAAVSYQIRSLLGIARNAGATLSHVKPHGALYNQAAHDLTLAATIVRAIRDVNPALSFMGLPNSAMQTAAAQAGIAFLAEGFADRRYRADGSLTPRNWPGAVIDDPDLAVRQALELVLQGGTRCINGTWVTMHIDTLCLHGDGPHALTFVERLATAFQHERISVRATKRFAAAPCSFPEPSKPPRIQVEE